MEQTLSSMGIVTTSNFALCYKPRAGSIWYVVRDQYMIVEWVND